MFFSTVWGWIKRWFDPITVSKIFILSHHEVKPVLTSFIDPANIPTQYGGELDFKWGDMPNLDPVIRGAVAWENGFDEFPKGPVYWRPIDGGARLECVAVGSVEQKERLVRVATIPVAFADEKVNGHAVHRMAEDEAAAAPAAAEQAAEEAPDGANGKLVEAKADIPEGPEPTGAEAPVVVDGVKEAEVPASLTGEKEEEKAEEKGKDVLVTETQGVQNLSITDEKKVETDTATNGQAVVA
jgi:hypothetical protein